MQYYLSDCLKDFYVTSLNSRSLSYSCLNQLSCAPYLSMCNRVSSIYPQPCVRNFTCTIHTRSEILLPNATSIDFVAALCRARDIFIFVRQRSSGKLSVTIWRPLLQSQVNLPLRVYLRIQGEYLVFIQVGGDRSVWERERERDLRFIRYVWNKYRWLLPARDWLRNPPIFCSYSAYLYPYSEL